MQATGERTGNKVVIPPLPLAGGKKGDSESGIKTPAPATERPMGGQEGVKVLLQTAKGYEQTCDFSQALMLYRTAVKRAYETAECRSKVGDWEGAAAAFMEAREYAQRLMKCMISRRMNTDPDTERWRTYYLERMAECKARSNNLADSIELWIHAGIERRDLGDFGGSARAHIEAANCFMLMARDLMDTNPKETTLNIRKAADQTVHAAECTMKVGQRKYAEEDWEQTVQEYVNAAQLFSNASEQYGHIGLVRAQIANMGKAEECMASAEKLQGWMDAQKERG